MICTGRWLGGGGGRPTLITLEERARQELSNLHYLMVGALGRGVRDTQTLHMITCFMTVDERIPDLRGVGGGYWNQPGRDHVSRPPATPPTPARSSDCQCYTAPGAPLDRPIAKATARPTTHRPIARQRARTPDTPPPRPFQRSPMRHTARHTVHPPARRIARPSAP